MIHPPPVDMLAPEVASLVFASMCFVTFAIFAAWTAYQFVRTRDPIYVALMAGGLACVMIEPYLDYLGLLWHAKNGFLIFYHPFDRYITLWMLFGYGFYYAGLAVLAYSGLSKGKSKNFLWYVYIFGWILDAIFEVVGDQFGLYKYYGPQPLTFLGSTPLYWEFINPLIPITMAVLTHVFKESFAQWKSILVILMMPMMYGALYGATCWPVFITLHSDVEPFVINVAALYTVAMSLAITTFVISLVDPTRVSLLRTLFKK